MATAILLGLAVLIFGVPAALGHPVVPGDDLTQNYPLRILVGRDLAHGHLPLLNPYLWSGAPLLGGWNAGAADPFTWLFAILPGTAAWSVNQVIISAAAGLGTFAFLRATKLGPLASFLGALTFADAGAMAAQVSHIGLLAGMSMVPWMLLALLRLSEPDKGGRRLPWILLFASAGGLCVLAGEPRAVDDAVVLVGGYAIWRAIKLVKEHGPTELLRFAAFAGIGAGVAVAVSAAQWAPGLAAVASSQRGVHTTFLYDSGSLFIRWLSLLFVPDLLGGSGSWHQPGFLPTYNLTEVTGYVGILSVVAAISLPFRRRDSHEAKFRTLPEWIVWEVLAAIGIILALGSNTPVGHVLAHVPFFGDQRLQSRNLLVTDFALGILLAMWVDRLLGSKPTPSAEATALPDSHPDAAKRAIASSVRWSEILAAIIPGAIVVLAIAWGAGLLQWLGVQGVRLDADGSLRPWLAPSFVLSALAVLLVMKGPKWSTRARSIAVASFVVLDVLAFTITSVVAVGVGFGPSATATPNSTGPGTPSTPSTATTPSTSIPATRPPGTPSSINTVSVATVQKNLGIAGRFAVYDPGLVNPAGLTALGVPDNNSLTPTPSIQGYGSIVDATYATATGTHTATGNGQNSLSVTSIGNGDLDQLDTTLLFTTQNYLVDRAATGLPNGAAALGRRVLAPTTNTTWYLGQPQVIPSARISCQGQGGTSATVEVGVVDANNVVTFAQNGAAMPCSQTLAVTLPNVSDAVGLVLRSENAKIIVNAPTVSTNTGELLTASSTLQSVLLPPHWRYAAFDGPFVVFRDYSAISPLTLRTFRAPLTHNIGFIHALDGPRTDPGSAMVDTTHGGIVIRSVSAIPGWRATWRPTPDRSGPSSSLRTKNLPIRRDGLIQEVTVPPGLGTVTWIYDPPGWSEGQALSFLGLAGLFGLLLASLFEGRRRFRSLGASPENSASS